MVRMGISQGEDIGNDFFRVDFRAKRKVFKGDKLTIVSAKEGYDWR
jgi:hypothetical protein